MCPSHNDGNSDRTGVCGESIHFDDCERVVPRGQLCHTVRFSQLLLFGCAEKLAPGKHGYMIAQPQYLGLAPSKEITKTERRAKVQAVLKRYLKKAPVTRSLESGELPLPDAEGEVAPIRKFLAEYAPDLCKGALDDSEARRAYKSTVEQQVRREVHQASSVLRRGSLRGKVETVADLGNAIERALYPEPYQPLQTLLPHLGLCVILEQEWCHKGYTRGERVASIGLAPGEELTLEMHSWTKENFKSERELAVEADMTLTNRITSRDHLEVANHLASKTSFGANANVNLTIPLGDVPLGVGAGANSAGELSNALDTTLQKTTEATREAVNSLKSQRKLRIEVARETGRDDKQLRKVANTNRCHTLNVHYFEVMSNFEVTWKLVDIRPCVLFRAPAQAITPAWVLCHEHIIKAALIDKAFLPGLEAARTLEIQDELDAIAESRPLDDASSPSASATASSPSSPFEDELGRHRDAILEAFDDVEEAWEEAGGDFADMENCLGSDWWQIPVCIGAELISVTSRLPRIIYLGILLANPVAHSALIRLRNDQNVPASEALRTFFAVASPRDYQFNVVAATAANGLDALGLPEPLVSALVMGGLIDLIADDAGLYNAVKAARDRVRELAGVQQAADFQSQAGATFEEGAAAAVFAEPLKPISDEMLAEARVEFARLRCHLEENRAHYFHAIWSRGHAQLPSLYEGWGCLADRTPVAFHEDRAAYPINLTGAFERWLKFGELIAKAREQFAEEWPEPECFSLPTPGPVAEATVGECCACEDYIIDSRDIDLRQRGAVALQEEIEGRRRQERVNGGMLEPFEPCCCACHRCDGDDADDSAATPGTSDASEQ